MKRATVVVVGITAALATAALGQVRLDPRPAAGSSRSVQTMKADQKLVIAGQEVVSQVESVVTTSRTTAPPDAAGGQRAEEKVERLVVRMSLPGGIQVAYDDGGKDAKHDVPEVDAIVDTFRAMKGASYTYVYGKDGRVTAVEGIDRILAAAPPAGLEMLKLQLTEARLRREANELLARLPDTPVKKGDRWQRSETVDLGAGQSFTVERFYEYQGTVERDGRMLDRITLFTGSVKYAIDPRAPVPIKVVNSDLKVAASLGSLLFDRERREVIEAAENLRVTGPVTFSVNGMELAGSLDLTLDTHTGTKPLAK